MRQRGRSGAWVAALVAVLTLSIVATAPAHVRMSAGPYTLELGWAAEPAYSGARNAIELAVEDAAGAPVADRRAPVRVEVRFGAARRTLALTPAAARGRFAAAIVPTRPGVYALHVTGTVRGHAVDVSATCSQRTFECVESADEIAFPVAEPAGGQLDLKLDRALARAQRAGDRAARAQTVAALAVAVAVTAVIVAFLLARQRARRG